MNFFLLQVVDKVAGDLGILCAPRQEEREEQAGDEDPVESTAATFLLLNVENET